MRQDTILSLKSTVESVWEERETLGPESAGPIRDVVAQSLDLLDQGRLRIAERQTDGAWQVNTWLKKAVLLSFRLHPMSVVPGAPEGGFWWDKIAQKTADWSQKKFEEQGVRFVPGSYVRHGAYLEQNCVLMPSFVNIGAYIGTGTMVDTWATIGSCAQIGAHCHISGGAGIGGVLEPLQASPVILEDNCFVGARSEIAEGVIVREGAVIAMGVYLSASTKIVDRETGQIVYGEVPPYSVLVPGTLPDSGDGPSLACAVIVKKVDAKTRAKTDINSLLRF